ncbi:MAG TPA: hypothetical protein VD913_04450 [bacterium]|nr:hypothetical protein [bacterium]
MDFAKLSIKSFAFAAGVLWGFAVLFVGLANLMWPDYGRAFLDCVASIYPGYDGVPSIVSVVILTAYGVIDGSIGGIVFAWLYNLCASKKESIT